METKVIYFILVFNLRCLAHGKMLLIIDITMPPEYYELSINVTMWIPSKTRHVSNTNSSREYY
jgi:hypothetical protein